NGHVRILDVVTSNEVDLGAGFEPTWSPDGRFIVFQLPSRYGDGRAGDLVRVPVASPQERSVLLSNVPSFFSFWTLGYIGPAVWLPDSRLIKVNHVAKEISVAHVVDTETGETADLPLRLDR